VLLVLADPVMHEVVRRIHKALPEEEGHRVTQKEEGQQVVPPDHQNHHTN